MTSGQARMPGNPSNGNLIAEPRLADYSEAERTPGFSAITGIEYR